MNALAVYLRSRSSLAVSATLVAASALSLGLFTKTVQVNAVTPWLLPFYPTAYWAHHLVLVFCLVGTAWFGWSAVGKRFSLPGSHAFLKLDGLTFTPFLFLGIGVPFRPCLLTVFLLKVACFVALTYRERKRIIGPRLKEYALVLVSIVAFQATFNGIASPLNWDNPLAALNRQEGAQTPTYASLYRASYLNAHNFDISGYDPAYWGSLTHAPTKMWSAIVPLLALAFDLPTLDVEAFERLLQQLIFFLSVVASFSFYLVLRRGLHFSLPVSFFGSVGYLFFNPYFAKMYGYHVADFIVVYLTVPTVVAFLMLAFRRSDPFLAAMGGFFSALPLYIGFYHPEQVIHGGAFVGACVLFLVLCGPRQSLARRLWLGVVFGLAYAAGIAMYAAPILEAALNREMMFWGHYEGVFRHGLAESHQLILAPLGAAYGICFFYGLFKGRSRRPSKEDFPYFFFFTAVAVGMLAVFIPGKEGLASRVLEKVHSIYFLIPERALMYLGFSSLVVAAYGAEALTAIGSSKRSFLSSLRVGVLLLWLYLVTNPHRGDELGAPYFSALVAGQILLVSIGAAMANKPQGTFVRVLPIAAVLALGVFVLSLPHLPQFASAKKVDNEQNCRPYVRLASVLANYEALAWHPAADSRYLQSRIDSFARDCRHQPVPSPSCQAKLPGVAGSSSPETVLDVARAAAPSIDRYYETEQPCVYARTRRLGGNINTVPDYGLAAILAKVPRFQRVMGATGGGDITSAGIGEGFLFNNPGISIDSRKMAGFAAIDGLFLNPGFYYDSPGEAAPTGLGKGVEVIAHPIIRRLNNIAGIDYFITTEAEWNRDFDKSELEISQRLPPFVLIKDKLSYGLAYAAKPASYVPHDPLRFRHDHWPLETGSEAWKTFTGEVKEATDHLLRLPERYTAVVSSPHDMTSREVASQEASVSVAGMRGNKVALAVDCPNPYCLIVLNLANVLGWKAFAGKTNLPIETVNYAFMGVNVPRGNHVVWFEHRRTSVILGDLVTMLSLLLFFAAYYRKTAQRVTSNALVRSAGCLLHPPNSPPTVL